MPSKVVSDHGRVQEWPAWRDQNGDKPRGLTNAALAHAKHGEGVERHASGMKATSEAETAAPRPAVIVERGRSDAEPGSAGVYSPAALRSGLQRAATVSLEDGASVKANVHIRQTLLSDGAGAGGGLILGEGASLKINAHIDTLVAGAGGTLILEQGASVKINAHVGTFNANGGTMVVGEGAKLQLNLHADAVSSGRDVIIADGADIKANVHVKTVEAPRPEPAGAPAGEWGEPEEVERQAPGKAKKKPQSVRREDEVDKFSDLKSLRWRLLDELVASAERGKRGAKDDGPSGIGLQLVLGRRD
jgi:hypothetical protein